MTHQLSPFRRWFELGLALDPQMIHPLPSTHGLRLRRRLRHLPALRLLAALFGGRGGVGIRIGAGSSLRRRCKHTSAKLLLDESLLDNAGVGRRNSFGGCVDKWMGKGRGGVGGGVDEGGGHTLSEEIVDQGSSREGEVPLDGVSGIGNNDELVVGYQLVQGLLRKN